MPQTVKAAMSGIIQHMIWSLQQWCLPLRLGDTICKGDGWRHWKIMILLFIIHPGKANVVADALSRKSVGQLSSLELREFEMHAVIEDFELCLGLEGHGPCLYSISARPMVIQRIVEAQVHDEFLEKVKTQLVADAHRRVYHPPWEYQDVSRLKEIVLVEWDEERYCSVCSYCQICQQVKAEHQRPAGLLQPLPIPEWKWDNITMDFVIGLPRTRSKKNGVWMIVDRLTKSTHFLAMKTIDSMNSLAKLYIQEIVRLHGIPVSIVSDRDPKFTSQFWQSLQRTLGTQLNFSTAFHPQTDGQSERVIQILEDMFKGLSPFGWIEMGESRLLGPEIVQETTEKIQTHQGKLKTAQDRQKVMQTKGEGPWSLRKGLGVCKSVPSKRHISIWEEGEVSPRKCTPDPTWVVDMQDVQISEDTSYVEEPLRILEVGEHRFRNKVIPAVKVWWQHHGIEEATWEPEEEMRRHYPQLFYEF
ncbi:Transposon Ty3-G Gag-Pol polyprotein [Vitis vinifera]|uniref:Transposon Ty3-G Gag-Pol polyprotein n=1 Tax=Vitis vinifera TaxID=29760 RepID=A0A438E4X6_VITVI|nr:Transposon Ty3-G Gag-Pol polyprotein [Vitis vinifera]